MMLCLIRSVDMLVITHTIYFCAGGRLYWCLTRSTAAELMNLLRIRAPQLSLSRMLVHPLKVAARSAISIYIQPQFTLLSTH